MLLPEDIENLRFEVAFRGYNTREVDDFLNKLSSDLEEITKEQEILRKKVAAAEMLAKDAEDRQEEFVASMSADRKEATDVLESAKAEGERIIREAKNAAAGIMAEVRRRAGEISAEGRRTAAEIAESAKKEAEDTLFSARTEAENITKAAEVHAKSVEDEAKKNSRIVIEGAKRTAKECEQYMNEIRASAEKLCRELDIELKNSAARITLLGRRIATTDIAKFPEDEEDIRLADNADTVSSAPAESEDTADTEPLGAYAADASASKESTPAHSDEPAQPKAAKKAGGYFTEEYRQVMEELFGEGVEISDASVPEDDDTYDYLDKVSSVSAKAVKPVAAQIDDDDDLYGDDGDSVVTSEYTGLPSSDIDDPFSGDSSVERIYKSPNADDISDIMNNF